MEFGFRSGTAPVARATSSLSVVQGRGDKNREVESAECIPTLLRS